jgi:hypothetical protein
LLMFASRFTDCARRCGRNWGARRLQAFLA